MILSISAKFYFTVYLMILKKIIFYIGTEKEDSYKVLDMKVLKHVLYSFQIQRRNRRISQLAQDRMWMNLQK